MSAPEDVVPQELQDLVDEQVTAKRAGWDVEPDDDTDIAWKDEDGPGEDITGEFGYVLAPNSNIPFVALVDKIPVDPDTVKAV